MDVELEKLGRFNFLTHLLDAHRGKRGDAKPCVEPLRDRCNGPFALPVKQALQRRG